HAPYLVNLASADPELAQRSVALLAHELVLAQRLGLAGVVVHPGSAGRESRQEAVVRVRRRLNEVFARAAVDTPLLLENTAGAGNLLGVRVQEVLELAELSWWQVGRVGLCLDTAHLWAAGYDLQNGGFRHALRELADAGLSSSLKLVHINDTPVPLGSRRDRHAAPGTGELGEGFFMKLLGVPALTDVACIMEIPPGSANQGVREALEQLRRWLPTP
ncbi:MAG: deoxyribonuclease IV, partial [Thermoanaerobaculum sp.]